MTGRVIPRADTRRSACRQGGDRSAYGGPAFLLGEGQARRDSWCRANLDPAGYPI